MDASVTDHVSEHAEKKRRYEMRIGRDRVGFTQYHDDGKHRTFMHTEIDPDYQGQGLSSELIRFALADTKASGMRISAFCPTVAAYLVRHHEFDDIVDPVGTAD
jgi:uncharacterized protein